MISRMNAALFAKQAELKKNEKGFTLVELLVVVLIIGILAAIAIPFFLNQRQSAWEGQVTSDLKNAVTAAETFASSNNGKFIASGTPATPLSTGTISDVDVKTTLVGNGFRPTDDVTVVIVPKTLDGVAGAAYDLYGSNANITDKHWHFDSATGLTEPEEGAYTP